MRVSRILGSYHTLNRGLLLTVTNQDAKSFARLLRNLVRLGNHSRRFCKKVMKAPTLADVGNWQQDGG